MYYLYNLSKYFFNEGHIDEPQTRFSSTQKLIF